MRVSGRKFRISNLCVVLRPNPSSRRKSTVDHSKVFEFNKHFHTYTIKDVVRSKDHAEVSYRWSFKIRPSSASDNRYRGIDRATATETVNRETVELIVLVLDE